MKIGDRVFVRGYIDEIHKDTVIIRNAGGYFGTIPSEVITGELPSAQPDVPDTNVGDTISRQAAIDEIRRCRFVVDAIEKISGLPSAQLEIIHCMDCDWWTKQDDSIQGRCALMGAYPTGWWFCGNAKRKDGEADEGD